MIGRRRSPPAKRALATLACLLLAATAQAQAPAMPIGQASVDELVDMLQAGGARTRAFARGNRPDAATNLCRPAAPRPAAGQAGAGAQGPATPGANGANTGTSGKRNLVVEAAPAGGAAAAPPSYAGDSTPGVQLDIGFGNASDKLNPREAALLDNLAKALQHERLASTRFAVAGHTDSSGKAELNLELSCARALAVVEHLARRGIQRERMAAYGFGSARPLASLGAEAPQNRRVEVRLEN